MTIEPTPTRRRTEPSVVLGGPVDAPRITPTLRPETEADAPFLFELFAAGAREILAPANLPEATLAHLLGMQHRARTAAYTSTWPQARGWVAWVGAARAGRLLEADTAEGVHIVDIAVAPAFRRRGLARAMISGRLEAQAALGGRVGAEAAVDNQASLALFGSLGFQASVRPGESHVALHWDAREAGAA